jgi:hypothetical protein
VSVVVLRPRRRCCATVQASVAGRSSFVVRQVRSVFGLDVRAVAIVLRGTLLLCCRKVTVNTRDSQRSGRDLDSRENTKTTWLSRITRARRENAHFDGPL